MNIRAIFENGEMTIVIDAETDQEQRLLSLLCHDGSGVVAEVVTRFVGHFSYQRLEAMQVRLRRPKQ